MDYHVVEAGYLGAHTAWLRFRDGSAGEIEIAPVLEGPIFEPLHDAKVFREFQVQP